MDDQRADREGGAGLKVAISATIVLVGFVMTGPIYHLCYYAMNEPEWDYLLLLPVTLGMYFGGAMLMGAGLFLPFKRPWLGAKIGFAVRVMIMLAIYFTDPPD